MTLEAPDHTARPCLHHPVCPSADANDRDAARADRRHPEQGWSRLCNGVILFEDGGEILPGGGIVAARCPTPRVPLD